MNRAQDASRAGCESVKQYRDFQPSKNTKDRRDDAGGERSDRRKRSAKRYERSGDRVVSFDSDVAQVMT